MAFARFGTVWLSVQLCFALLRLRFSFAHQKWKFQTVSIQFILFFMTTTWLILISASHLTQFYFNRAFCVNQLHLKQSKVEYICVLFLFIAIVKCIFVVEMGKKKSANANEVEIYVGYLSTPVCACMVPSLKANFHAFLFIAEFNVRQNCTTSKDLVRN